MTLFHLQLLDDESGNEIEVMHETKCSCCRGVGVYKEYTVECQAQGSQKEARKIKILNFDMCSCMECSEVSGIVLNHMSSVVLLS